MKIDTEKLKSQLDIVEIIGQHLDLKREGSGFKACCPFHDEKTPSFNVNPTLKTFKCFGCDANGDVIEFIMKYKGMEFKEAAEYLGGGEFKTDDRPKPKKNPNLRPQQKKTPAKIVALTYPEAAQEVYTLAEMERISKSLRKNQKYDNFIEATKYFNEKSEVELVAARWENDNGQKTVLSFYYNGKSLQMKNYPVLLLNRDKLATEPDKDVIIVFGEKCAKVAERLPEFIVTTWNGGEKKVKEVDLSPLKNRVVYVWPDDDHQNFVNGPDKGKLMPPEKQPGNITAAAIVKALPHAQIVDVSSISEDLKKYDESGADIFEAFAHFEDSAEAVSRFIYENAKRSTTDNESNNTSIESKVESNTSVSGCDPDPKSWPFTILGIADDGKAYFIGSNDRMLDTRPTSISRNFMMALIGVDWWRNAYGKDKEAWEDATSDMIHVSSLIDFDPDRMRGRGAWREPDGRICYHDGQKTTGEFSTDRIYLRRARKNIGILNTEATADQRKRMRNVAEKLSFKGYQDFVKMLAWAIISPFAGALEWRPAALLTADSQSGKSSIINFIIKPLSGAKICSGGSTTEAGIRQNIGIDTVPVIVEESEADTPKKKQNRDDTFSLMRQSTSDDSPPAWKGTQDGKGMNFVLRSMFCFVGIDPAISSWADENRLFRAELVKPTHSPDEWDIVEAELKAAFSDEMCAGVRAYTWNHLQDIIRLYKRVTRFVHKESAARSIRTSKADAILLATFLAVIEDQPNADDEYISGFVKMFYAATNEEPEAPYDENSEMLEKILNHTIRDGSDNFSLRDLLLIISDDLPEGCDPALTNMAISRARRIAGDYGIGMTAPDDSRSGSRHYAIAKNHKKIMGILEKDRGYYLQLARHPQCISKGKNVGLGTGKTANCVIIERVEE